MCCKYKVVNGFDSRTPLQKENPVTAMVSGFFFALQLIAVFVNVLH